MLLAMSLIVAGSVLNGIWAYPMKRVQGWKWENIWFLFGLFGLVIFPWLTALITVPRLFAVYAETPGSLIAGVAALGCAWGIGSLLFGLGVSALGLALGYALIIGTAAVLGTIVPALAVNMDLIATEKGVKLLAALVVLLAGLFCFYVAGKMRDAVSGEDRGSTSFQILSRTRFLQGLAICLFAGVLSACFNIGFAITEKILDAAVRMGASRSSATNAVWALVMSAGFIPSAVYCLFLFKRNGSSGKFRTNRVNWVYACIMGMLWMGSVVLYGIGAVSIGSAGATLGWPVLMAGTVIVANLLGLATGEWAKTDWSTKKYLLFGTGLLIIAVTVIGSAGV